jgi:glycosyltransferase involved in cell wall biosynthesis
MLEVLARVESPEIQMLVICNHDDALALVKSVGLKGLMWRRSRFATLLGKAFAQNFCKRMFGRWLPKLPFTLDAKLDAWKVDLVLFLGPDGRALELCKHNFIFSVWDLCHLDHPEFPEVGHFGEFERREYLFRNCVTRAVGVLVDSEHGRMLLKDRYGVALERAHVAPFLIYRSYEKFEPAPGELERVLAKHNVRAPYVFYPAQFWAHKNHKYILEAVRLMARRGTWVPQVVLSGSDKGSLAGVLDYARALGVDQYVNYRGFVDDSDMPYLYWGALALVMPTYFGPTNIPPLEARALGVPVCYSDLGYFRDQLGDSAHYMDLERPDSLVQLLDTIREQAAPRVRRNEPGAEAEQVGLLRRIVNAYRAKLIGAGPSVARAEGQ